MLRPASEPPANSGQQLTGVISIGRPSGVSGVAVWFCCDGFCLLVVCLRALLFVFVVGLGGPEEPKNMRTTKMKAMSGSTMAAIILLRSAGVFPSNRAMNLNSLPPPRAARQNFSRRPHSDAAAARRKYAAMSRRRLTSAPRAGAAGGADACAPGGGPPSGFTGIAGAGAPLGLVRLIGLVGLAGLVGFIGADSGAAAPGASPAPESETPSSSTV